MKTESKSLTENLGSILGVLLGYLIDSLVLYYFLNIIDFTKPFMFSYATIFLFNQIVLRIKKKT